MNNKPIDMKNVLFTLNQLQSTLDRLARKTQSVPQDGLVSRPAFGMTHDNQANETADKTHRS